MNRSRSILLCRLACILFLTACMCKNAKQAAAINTMWYSGLPTCPCENPDKNGIALQDGWAKDAGNINHYHKGASECFRSYPAITTAEGQSCQQCCYDTSGHLISYGSGAGTPDKISTCDGEDSNGKMKTKFSRVLNHYIKDVKPWEEFGGVDSGWKKYNQLCVPDTGTGCSGIKAK